MAKYTYSNIITDSSYIGYKTAAKSGIKGGLKWKRSNAPFEIDGATGKLFVSNDTVLNSNTWETKAIDAIDIEWAPFSFDGGKTIIRDTQDVISYIVTSYASALTAATKAKNDAVAAARALKQIKTNNVTYNFGDAGKTDTLEFTSNSYLTLSLKDVTTNPKLNIAANTSDISFTTTASEQSAVINLTVENFLNTIGFNGVVYYLNYNDIDNTTLESYYDKGNSAGFSSYFKDWMMSYDKTKYSAQNEAVTPYTILGNACPGFVETVLNKTLNHTIWLTYKNANLNTVRIPKNNLKDIAYFSKTSILMGAIGIKESVTLDMYKFNASYTTYFYNGWTSTNNVTNNTSLSNAKNTTQAIANTYVSALNYTDAMYNKLLGSDASKVAGAVDTINEISYILDKITDGDKTGISLTYNIYELGNQLSSAKNFWGSL